MEFKFKCIVVVLIACMHLKHSQAVRPNITADGLGNIHISSSQKLFINGQDVLPMLEFFQELKYLDNPIYAIGGNSNDDVHEFVPIVEKFDGLEWTEASSLNQGRYAFGTCIFHDKIYVFGGHDGSTIDTTEVFNANSWVIDSTAKLPEPRGWFDAVVFEDKVYVIGGYNLDTNTFMSTVKSFDGQNWNLVDDLNDARAEAASLVYHDKVYAIGGTNGFLWYDSVEVFDGSSWQYGPSLNEARAWAGAAVFQDKIFVAGGYRDSYTAPRLRSVEIFDGSQWTLGPSMNVPRSSFQMIVSGNRLFAIGGKYYFSIEVVESFNGEKWQFEASLPTSRHGLGLIAVSQQN